MGSSSLEGAVVSVGLQHLMPSLPLPLHLPLETARIAPQQGEGLALPRSFCFVCVAVWPLAHCPQTRLGQEQEAGLWEELSSVEAFGLFQ